jgi:hypothetical protein
MADVVFTNYSSDTVVAIPLERITGMTLGPDDETMIETGHGMYYIVQETLIEAMRRCVAIADSETPSPLDT